MSFPCCVKHVPISNREGLDSFSFEEKAGIAAAVRRTASGRLSNQPRTIPHGQEGRDNGHRRETARNAFKSAHPDAPRLTRATPTPIVFRPKQISAKTVLNIPCVDEQYPKDVYGDEVRWPMLVRPIWIRLLFRSGLGSQRPLTQSRMYSSPSLVARCLGSRRFPKSEPAWLKSIPRLRRKWMVSSELSPKSRRRS